MIDPDTLSLSQPPGFGLNLPESSTGSAWKKMVDDTLDNARTAFTEHVVPQEDSDTLFQRGKSYYFGDGVLQNYAEALALFLQAATVGHPEAQFFTGECHAFGLGTPKNDEEASVWYRQAADLGHTEAMMRLAECCHYRVNPDDEDRAEEARWYQRAADLGNSVAMRRMGDCCCQGRGVARNYTTAMNWYKRAAELGDAEACDSMGDCCYYGRGTPQNYAAAVTWYERGNKPAFQSVRYGLALYCSNPQEDLTEVLAHLNRVKDPYERCLLGCLVAAEERLEAYLWFRPASAAGDVSAQESLRALIPKMTSMERQAGEALCRDLV